MSDQKQYLLMFRGNDWYNTLSPEELQRISDEWVAWLKGLMEQGKAMGGNRLELNGKLISGKTGIVTDGPFVESKEAIGGYFFLTVADLDEAVAIARQCPGLPHGAKMELRPVAAECPWPQKP